MRTVGICLIVNSLLAGFIPPCNASLDLPVTEHILSNGMKVIALERPQSPVITFALYYPVGSVDESPGKRGMAHYCEHMMFKSTKNLEGESYARLLGAVGGGHSNANTSTDRTCYHETVPPDRLELVIRLEAERMANLQPTPEEAASELDVVLEELRQSYLDDPDGRLRFELYDRAFTVHPYKTITIGRLDDLKTITYDDLMAFQKKYYAPCNATAVIVGQFKTEELLDLMERFFGVIPAGEKITRVFPPEPEQTEERRFELNMPVRSPLYLAGYKAPAASHPDALALEVLTTILSHGGSTPFGKLSQGTDPVAMQVYAYCHQSLEPDLLIIGGLPLPGVPVEEMEKRIQDIIRNVVDHGVTSDQLQIARTQMLTREIYGMESSTGLAFSLGEAEMVGSWRDALNLEDRLNAITPDQLQAVASRYLIPSNRTVGIVRDDTGHAAPPDENQPE